MFLYEKLWHLNAREQLVLMLAKQKEQWHPERIARDGLANADEHKKRALIYFISAVKPVTAVIHSSFDGGEYI